jgi:DNA-directed RNA polymerase sigma subunit (sigma70/sigma32)
MEILEIKNIRRKVMNKAEELKQEFISDYMPYIDKEATYPVEESEQATWLKRLDNLLEQYAQQQRAACVRHYYDSDNKHGTLATIAETPLITDSNHQNQEK